MAPFSLDAIRGCPSCGLFTELPEPGEGDDIHCPRCKRILTRRRHHSTQRALAYAVAGFVFCLVFGGSPFLDVLFYGRHQVSTLWLGPQKLGEEHLWPLSLLVLFTTLLLPTLKLGLMIAVLYMVNLDEPPPIIVPLFRWMNRISPWAMLEVFLLGLLVAYTRIQDMAYVPTDIAVYALIGAILSLAAADSILDKEEVWDEIRHKGLMKALDETENTPLLACHTCHQASRRPTGTPCPRCQAVLHYRKPKSMSHAWAFLVAAIVLYIPANSLPIMDVTSFGVSTPYTITGGMRELAAHDLLPLAMLVFVASIAITFLKMLSLCYLLATTHNGSERALLARTQLYRVIDLIGRWSMVDVFMLSILVALIHFGQFAQITANSGAIYFAGVVILTMVAVECFDPRLMWDTAEKNGPIPDEEREEIL